MYIKSPVMGTLAMLHVGDDEKVEEGEMLCEIEVMKVFYRVHAPCSGMLDWFCKLGAVVGEGETIGAVR